LASLFSGGGELAKTIGRWASAGWCPYQVLFVESKSVFLGIFLFPRTWLRDHSCSPT
jgi:hypothetical protein